MAYPPPPTTPPAPQRGDRATFSSRVDAFLTWVAAIIPWLQGYIADFMATLSTLAAGGANSFSYRFSSDTGVADPGPGTLRLNNPAQSSSSRLIIDSVDGNSVNISQVLNSVTASTSATKGSVRLQKVNDPSAWMLFDITGFTAASGFYNLTISSMASSNANPFADNDGLVVFIQAKGDRGDNGGISYSKFSDRKAFNTASGYSISGLQDRTLNTTDFNGISGATRSGSNFTLPSGSYDVHIRCPSFNAGASRGYLYNVTDSTTLLQGSNAVPGTNQDSVVTGAISITSPKTFKIQQYTVSASENVGLGNVVAIPGQMEIYTEVIIRKIS